jgi:hypothetical protein
VRDEDHKDVHPALPWSACTIRAGTRGLAVCGWAAESPIIALRKMPEALCVASLRHVVVCRVQRPPLVCSEFWHNKRLTGSIPPQLSSLNKLTKLCVRPCLIPLRPRCHAGALFVVALHRSLVCDIRHKLTAAAGVQRITWQLADWQHPTAAVIAEQADLPVCPPMQLRCRGVAWNARRPSAQNPLG